MRIRLPLPLRLCLIALAAAMAAPLQVFGAISPELVFQVASRSVVTLQAVDGSGQIVARGSGVTLQKNIVVTNCHVIGRGTVYFAVQSKKRLPARLVAYDAPHDLCALAVSDLVATPARVADLPRVRIGHRVYAIGSPEGFDLTLSEGLISGLRESDAGSFLQTTAAISEGSSGGGLFDDSGRLVGIISFSFSTGQNLNFAIPATGAAELAKKAAAIRVNDTTPLLELPASVTRQWRSPLLR